MKNKIVKVVGVAAVSLLINICCVNASHSRESLTEKYLTKECDVISSQGMITIAYECLRYDCFPLHDVLMNPKFLIVSSSEKKRLDDLLVKYYYAAKAEAMMDQSSEVQRKESKRIKDDIRGQLFDWFFDQPLEEISPHRKTCIFITKD
jgi:DNA recombination-dependent growth factor C